MNNPQGSQDGIFATSRQRPGIVTALALLVILDAIAEGCGGIARALQADSSLVGGITAVFMLVLIAVMAVLAVGLWNMKNWARIGLIFVIVISFLASLPQWISSSPESPALTFFVILLALAFRGAVIYWLAANGRYFQNTAIDASSQGEIAGNGVSPMSGNSGGSGGISRSIIAGSLAGAGLIAIVACIAMAYFLHGNTQPLEHQVLSFGSAGTGQGMLDQPDVIGMDGDGNIVVGDFKDGRVQTFDAGGKVISSFTVTKGSAGETNVTGMAVSRDGTIYITGDIDSAILIYDEKGTFLGQIVDSLHNYNDVAFGPGGTLYALTDISLVRFKKDGTVDLNVPISDIVYSSHLAVDGLGNIYVTDFTTDQVFKFSPTGTLLTQFSRGGNKSTSVPTQIAVDGYGRIFLNDTAGNVQAFDSNGKHLGDISGTYDGLVFDKQNNLYANNIIGGHVVKFQIQQPASGALLAGSANNSSNNPVVPTPTPGFSNNILTFRGTIVLPIQAISVKGNGNIVLGYSNGQLQTFDGSGKLISTTLITLPNAADGPASLAIGRDEKIYAQQGGTIYVFDGTGKLLQKIGDNKHFYRNIAIGPDDTLYATTDEDVIVHFDPNGKISLEIPKAFGKVSGSPESHAQIAVDGQGNIFVAGPMSGLVLNFTAKGHYVGAFRTKGSAGFVQSEGIAVDGYGRIYISDAAGDIQVYDSSGSYVNSIQGLGAKIAVDNQNNLYVVDTSNEVNVFQLQKPAGK